jgi:uncharacterized protein (DUF1015 family)
MAWIRPFLGLRFTASSGLGSLIAPPYDVLSPAQRDEFAARDPHNVVHLTLPESKPDDRSKYVKYARSAAALAEWRREGVLAPESKPALYLYRQRFRVPGLPEELERTAFIALLKVEPFEAGVVLPHERTFPKHKEDRLRILEATRAHLETIFGLYEDTGNQVATALASAPVETIVEATDDDAIHHSLAVISDEASLAGVRELLLAKQIWIADGHHRYETALTFRQSVRNAEGEVAEDYIPIALTSMSDPGLVLLPTHRILDTFAGTQADAISRLSTDFKMEPVPAESLMASIEAIAEKGETALGVLFAGGDAFAVIPRDAESLYASMDPNASQALRKLDVSVLHDVILDRLLGVKGVEGLKFTRDEGEALAAAKSGAAMVWLMNPPTVDDMKTIALGGERMPQKSTYYFPKVESGFVLWSLNDF